MALNQRRQVQKTKEFHKKYGTRAGVESTHSQAFGELDFGALDTSVWQKTHLQHVLTAIAINLVRLDAWFNDISLAKTRVSRFKREL